MINQPVSGFKLLIKHRELHQLYMRSLHKETY